MIRFLQPWWLLAVLPVLAVAGAYVWRQWRKRAYAVRFTNVELLRTLAPKGIGPRRHLAAGAFLASLLVLALGLARPSVDAKEPLERATVMLAIDVSLSMQSTDVAPTRIEAAEKAGVDFIRELPATFNVGVVAFAKSANVLVSPTKDHAAAIQALSGLQLAESTATGEAIQASLASIRSVATQIQGPEEPPPGRVILLSDGKQTIPSDPEAPRGAFTAADQAKQQGVPISAISFGTDYGEIEIEGRPVPVAVADADMQEIARRSGGDFSKAASQQDLRETYDTLREQIGYETTEVNRGDDWMLAGAVFVVLGLGTAFALGARLP